MEAVSNNQKVGRPFSIAAIILSVLGLIDSGYLTGSHYAGINVPCSVVSGCDTVLKSDWAEVFGIPTALYGVIAYFFAFSLAYLVFSGRETLWKLFGLLSAAMFIGSAFLMYVQAFVIQSFCQYCIVSAITSTLLFVVFVVSILSSKRSG